MNNRRYKITIEYDGAYFCGWQRQIYDSPLPSVQGCIEDAILKLSGKIVDVVASGRTDVGVHALGQVAHFDLQSDLEATKIMLGINFHLRSYKIAIIRIEIVNSSFHARFSALSRHYRYRIINRPVRAIIEKNFVWQVFSKMNYEKFLSSSQELIGYHNFNGFRSSACESNNTYRKMNEVLVTKNKDLIEIDFISKAFLYNQVRIMVGTLVDISLGKPINIKEVLEKGERRLAGMTAPAKGLYLLEVNYEN